MRIVAPIRKQTGTDRNRQKWTERGNKLKKGHVSFVMCYVSPTDIATYRLNHPLGQFIQNPLGINLFNILVWQNLRYLALKNNFLK